MIAEKRRRIEEQLWAIHEANIGDYFETVEVAKVDRDGKAETDEAGNMLTVKTERIEDVTIDSKGRAIPPKLYSELFVCPAEEG